jgi:hypothetical protein
MVSRVFIIHSQEVCGIGSIGMRLTVRVHLSRRGGLALLGLAESHGRCRVPLERYGKDERPKKQNSKAGHAAAALVIQSTSRRIDDRMIGAWTLPSVR